MTSYRWPAMLILAAVVDVLLGQNLSPSLLGIDSDHIAVLADPDQWQLGPRRTYLLGKIISYRLNAYDDYSIGDIILTYIASGFLPGDEDEMGRVDLFYWTFVTRGETQPIADYVSAHTPLALRPDVIAALIRKLTGFTRFPDLFLRGAANGQTGAKQWDHLFVSLCRRGFARSD